jgi:molybdate transport system substrate-binding protein
MKHVLMSVALMLAVAAGSTSPIVAQGSSLRVIASNGIKDALERLQPEIERATGTRLSIEWGASNVLRRTIEGGSPFDIAILTPGIVDELVKAGHLTAASRADLARSDVAVAARKGAPKTDVSTADALKRRLLAARSTTYARDGASAAALTTMMATLGIAEAMKSKIVLQPPSVRPADAVAAGQEELVLAPLSELQSPGLQVLGLLPKEFQSPLVLTGAVSAHAAQPAAASAMLAYLTSAKAVAAFKATGMEPLASK